MNNRMLAVVVAQTLTNFLGRLHEYLSIKLQSSITELKHSPVIVLQPPKARKTSNNIDNNPHESLIQFSAN
jgi:hypothetical protein